VSIHELLTKRWDVRWMVHALVISVVTDRARRLLP
jgi:hypothetical protein